MFLYQKVFEDLKKQILDGEHPCGTLLPSEREIGEIYHVDRTTVRKAFQLLVEENLVEKRAGKGTVVTYQNHMTMPSAPAILNASPAMHVSAAASATAGSAAAASAGAVSAGDASAGGAAWVTSTVNDPAGTVPGGPHAASSAPSFIQQNGTIAFLLPKSNRNSDRITVPFYSQLFYGVEKNCRRLGFSLIYSTLDESDNLEAILTRNITNLAGVIFVSNIAEQHIDQAIRLGIPAILINSSSSKITSIAADNYSGTYSACEHLIRLGHRDICVLNGIEHYHSAQERLRGVRHAMKDHNMTLREKNIISGNSWEFEGGFEATSTMLQTFDRLPTAIIAFNDRLASGAMQAIQQKGLRVPEDISVIGFDNSELAMYSMPKLSSVEINIPIMAKASVANLFYQIRVRENIPVKILVPVTYIERESVKAPTST